MDSVHDDRVGVEPITGLCRFRDGFYSCLGARADAQFELTEALLCADGPVRSLVDLSLAPEHRRGHGALYDGLNHGSIEVARLRRGVAGLPLPRVGDRIVLAADVSPWLRPDAETSPARLFCHVHGRAKGTAQMIPGWPYSVVAALGSGRSSWTAVLDAVRLGPADDATAVTAGQLRQTVDRLRAVGHWRPGDPTIWIVLDSGYDVTRLAFLLADLPVRLIGRLRSDRVLARPVSTPSRYPRPPAPPWPAAGAGRPGHLARPRAHQQHRHHPLRHRAGQRLASLPPAAGTPRPLARAPRPAADHRRHPDPAAGRAPARRPRPETAVAVDQRPGRGRHRRRPGLAGLPAPLRPRTHVQVPQADPRLDHPQAARSRRRRSLDLAGHRRAHPAAPGP